ncbi:MAG: potassium transporter TrkG [Bacteroidota bacterium]
MINTKIIANLLGLLLIIISLLMFTVIPFSIYYQSNDVIAMLGSGAITFLAGFLLWKYKGKSKNCNNSLGKREGYIIVALGWIVMALFGSLPYIFSGAIPNMTNAFFETISGFTTTGASILNDIEAMPKGILFWRSMTQWIGGMGIIVMTIAILPILGIGGMQLFVAEVPGPTSDKIHPRIKETAKRLWAIYLLLTLLLIGFLMIGGMSFYDAINHAFTTMPTGGFSTKQASIAYFQSPFIHYIIIVFMFITGANYTLIYFIFNGKFRKLRQNEEFKIYVMTLVILTIVITSVLYIVSFEGIEKSFRVALFQVVSIVTTTGFVTADYTSWTPFITIIFLIMMFIGGCAGSTSGSIKIVRHLTLAKNCMLEFKRLLHPRAVIPVKLNSMVVAPNIMTNILVFILIYVIIFVVSSAFISLCGLDIKSSIGAVASTLGNVGPGIGTVGPIDNYYHVSAIGKWFLSFLMLLGRLELFTVLILFTPYFWKLN